MAWNVSLAGGPPVTPLPSDIWNPDLYRSSFGYVPKLGEELVELLAPGPGQRVLARGRRGGWVAGGAARRGRRVGGRRPRGAVRRPGPPPLPRPPRAMRGGGGTPPGGPRVRVFLQLIESGPV